MIQESEISSLSQHLVAEHTLHTDAIRGQRDNHHPEPRAWISSKLIHHPDTHVADVR